MKVMRATPRTAHSDAPYLKEFVVPQSRFYKEIARFFTCDSMLYKDMQCDECGLRPTTKKSVRGTRFHEERLKFGLVLGCEGRKAWWG
jgi:hypothetical protein